MENEKVNEIIMMYGKYLPMEYIETIRKRLLDMEYDQAIVVCSQMKDPLIALILSLTCGTFGIDRFYIGDVMLGVLKLITCGGLAVWHIIDCFLIMAATKEKNLQTLMMGYL